MKQPTEVTVEITRLRRILDYLQLLMHDHGRRNKQIKNDIAEMRKKISAEWEAYR